jgi:hypothetical protein
MNHIYIVHKATKIWLANVPFIVCWRYRIKTVKSHNKRCDFQNSDIACHVAIFDWIARFWSSSNILLYSQIPALGQSWPKFAEGSPIDETEYGLSESSYQCCLGQYPVDLLAACIPTGLPQLWTPSSEIYIMMQSDTSGPKDVLPVSPTRYPCHGPPRIRRSQRGLYWYTWLFQMFWSCPCNVHLKRKIHFQSMGLRPHQTIYSLLPTKNVSTLSKFRFITY